ncbi:hypothetical protein E2C01_093392 [Portunus trituberculatus]|uniref:Uncharacterized protein n=1 Tax=Portunus trituberculatus TaxID=210409 RepID=A0A5B7JPP2_PORTR|nr:hypothetical protein [Portunus trituberculatus]
MQCSLVSVRAAHAFLFTWEDFLSIGHSQLATRPCHCDRLETLTFGHAGRFRHILLTHHAGSQASLCLAFAQILESRI